MHPTIGQVLRPTMLLPPVPQTEEIQVRPSSNFNMVALKLTTFPTGHENLNKWFQSGDQAYIIVASAMVLVMVPGLGSLYSGLARRKICLVDDVGVYGGRIGHNIPMVLVGILVSFLADGTEWIHWRSQEVWLV